MVGVGVASPSATVHIKPPGSGDAFSLIVDGPGSSQGYIGLYRNASEIGRLAPSNDHFNMISAGIADIIFATGSYTNVAMIIDNSAGGNVGIGNSAPEEKLHITDGKLKIDRSSGAGTGDVEIHFDRRHDAADARIIAKAGASGAYGTELHFVTTHASNGEATGLVIDDNGHIYSDLANTKISGSSTSTGSFGALTINGSPLINGSSVGVEVGDSTGFSVNTAGDDLFIGSSTGTHGLTIGSANDQNGYIFFADPEANNSGFIGYVHATNAMRIFTSGSESVRIDDSGNVGIGNTVPDCQSPIWRSTSGAVFPMPTFPESSILTDSDPLVKIRIALSPC
jgi:hypothetical protein